MRTVCRGDIAFRQDELAADVVIAEHMLRVDGLRRPGTPRPVVGILDAVVILTLTSVPWGERSSSIDTSDPTFVANDSAMAEALAEIAALEAKVVGGGGSDDAAKNARTLARHRARGSCPGNASTCCSIGRVLSSN